MTAVLTGRSGTVYRRTHEVQRACARIAPREHVPMTAVDVVGHVVREPVRCSDAHALRVEVRLELSMPDRDGSGIVTDAGASCRGGLAVACRNAGRATARPSDADARPALPER